MTPSHRTTFFALVVSLGLITVACASDDDGSAADSELESLRDELAATESDLAATEADLSGVETDLAAAEGQLEEADEELEGLRSALIEQTQRADAAQATLDEFPVTVAVSAATSDVAGNYVVSFSEAYCSGFDACGIPLDIRAASIEQVPVGLRIDFPGAVNAGLFDVEGGLFGIADSTTIVPPCNGVPRRSRVTVTVFGTDVAIDAEGTSVVTDLSASLVVDVPDVEGCPGGLVFFGTDLSRAG